MSQGHVRNVPQRELTTGLQVVPASVTALTGLDTYVFQIVVSNVTGGSVDFTVTDDNGHSLIPTTAIAAGTSYVIAYPFGVRMIGGVFWQASAADSLHAEIYGTYAG